MTQAARGEAYIGLKQRAPRLVGFCGPSGQLHETFASLVSAVAPLLSPITEGANQTQSGFNTSCRSNASAPLLARSSRADGSFAILDGRLFREGDTIERLLDRWLVDGDDVFNHIGFYGFIAAWNAAASRCVLVRDNNGVTPAYVAETDRGVLFSTDQATLLAAGVDRTPNAEALDSFLATGHFPAPLTALSAVSKIPPGYLMSVTPDGLSGPERWHRGHRSAVVKSDEAVDLWRDSMTRAVERVWPENGDAGILLSGGIDSAAVMAVATQSVGRPMRAFTFRYESYEGELNEGGPAAAVATHLGMPHDEISIAPGDILDDLDAMVMAYDEPFTWGIHSYRLQALVDHGITGVFTGGGASGIEPPKRHRAAIKYNRLPAGIRRPIRSAVRSARPLGLKHQAKAEWLTRPVAGLGELYSDDSALRQDARRRLYRDPALLDRAAIQLLSIHEGAVRDDPSDTAEEAMYKLDTRFVSAETTVQWNRSWTLAHGVELCLPYYDPDLRDLSLNIEGRTPPKEVARRASTEYLTDEMAFAPRLAQQMPVGEWLRGPLSATVRERLSDMPAAMTEVFDPAGVLGTLDDHVRGKRDNAWLIIALLTTSSWFDQLTP
jgi:asparagine synthase (glutamine-hydrolysing)